MVRGNTYEALQKSHPCFGGQANNAGRIHLPVSPGCNIGCRFCDRAVNATEQRPGVTAKVISPEEALIVLKKALVICPEIRVVGIAGPGDTLATDYALETFRLIREKYPQLLRCMSTNGLLLDERAQEIVEAGVDSLTVTVNAVDPDIEARLNGFIFYHSRRYEGREAAEILIGNQLRGIRRVAMAGVTVKVNSVLVPGVNDSHIEAVARAVSEAGASIYNIIPLIPQNELKDVPAPDCAMIDAVRTKASRYIDVFRHCQHCRADAVGVPGRSEFSNQIYQRRVAAKETFSHG